MAKYINQEADGIRKALLDYLIQSTEEYEEKSKYDNDAVLIDVTGSLGCWGVQHE